MFSEIYFKLTRSHISETPRQTVVLRDGSEQKPPAARVRADRGPVQLVGLPGRAVVDITSCHQSTVQVLWLAGRQHLLQQIHRVIFIHAC